VPVDPDIWTPSADKIVTDRPTLGVGAPTDNIFLLEEHTRPGELMPAFEDEHGSYILNSKDLRARDPTCCTADPDGGAQP